MSIEQIIGGGVILLAAALTVVFGFLQKRLNKFPLRKLKALDNLQQSVGLTIENGKRLHVSLGSASILAAGNAASLTGLSMVEHLALISMVSDRPPLITSGEGSLLVLSQDVMRRAYRMGNSQDRYNPQLIQQTGFSPWSYSIGCMPAISQEQVQTSLLMGRFGPEAAFLNNAARRKDGYSLGATDDLTGQAVMLGTASDTLLGEELYAVPGYLNRSPFHRSSVQVQDVLRWLIIAVILTGVVLAVIGQIFGWSIL
jgi:hypothetical protein